MAPRRTTDPASDQEQSPDPLQMTPKTQAEELPAPTSARRSMRSRKVPNQETTPVAVHSARKTATSGRKRAQPDAHGESPSVKERASKRSKVDNGDEQIASPRKTTARDATKDNDPPKPEDTAAPPTRKRGRPAKTPAADPAKVTATPTRTAGTKKSTVVQPATETQLDASPVKASKSKRKQSAAPIRHSSNPLDEEPAESFTAVEAEADDTVSLAVADLAEPSTRTVGTAFDLTSEQSREEFLRNERWQRDKEARNFNFEGDVHEGRRLRSGKAVVVDTEESGEEDDDGEEDAGNESLDEDERRKRAVSTTTGEKEQEIAVFEADNDYLSQLTYDTTMPVETQKSTLNLPHFTSATATVSHDQPSSSVLTPLARKVLRTVISNLAGCETYTPATPMQPEEEKNEALVQLVNLLKGTVERGEGNSCLILGAKGSGKTKTVNRAISLVRYAAAQPPTNGHSQIPSAKEDRRPIIVRLDGLAQTNDMLAIREMGRQIALGQGERPSEDDDDENEEALQAAENMAPTTLPAHLLAHLTAPSARAIVVVIENFDLFTNHARQALLYCLLDVVQGVRTGPVASTGRGVAVIGVTSRMDTTLLLEKRVKSRFSQRIYRVISPLSANSSDAWRDIVRNALVPKTAVAELAASGSERDLEWLKEWESLIDTVTRDETVQQAAQRVCELTTDVRILLRSFIYPVQQFGLNASAVHMQPANIVSSITEQIHSTGWGKKLEKLRGLSHPSLVVLIIAKHFSYAGKEEFNLAMVEHEYQRFARTQLAGSGRARWSTGILEVAWKHLMQVGLLFPATRFRPSTNPYMQRFVMCRSLLSRNEIVAYFKGEGGKVLGTELTGWGRTAGGHA